jgi:hypothetical protein
MRREQAVRVVLARVAELDVEAKAILAGHEAASSRIVTLEGSYDQLTGLSLDQDELFREGLRAVESGLFRAAHVLAWAGFVDFLHETLIPTHLAALQGARPKWRLAAAEDLRDWGEHAVIEAGREACVYSKTTMKALHGLLNRRNECAHPSDYFPDLNETLGYISELFKRIKLLQKA